MFPLLSSVLGGSGEDYGEAIDPAAGDSASLLYGTYLGGSSDDRAYVIALGGTNQVYLTGFARSSNFPTANAFDDTVGGGNCGTRNCFDAFVAHLDLDTNTLVYSAYLGGTSDEEGWGIAADSSGNAYVTGYSLSSDFPTTPGAYDPTLDTAYSDAFVVRISGAVPPPLSWTTTYTYTYDPLYRLAGAAYSSGEFFEYTYDAVGNRLSETTHLGTTTYTYDDANRLADVNGLTYTWDGNGNLLSDGVSTYTYDHANRLTSVVGPSSSSSYAYNGQGDRLRQTVDGVTTNYTLDLNNWLTQVLADGTNTYLYGVARVAQYDVSGAEYFLGDALGSVRQLVDANSEIVLAKSYKPYGEVLTSAGDVTSNYGFAGEYTEATRLMNLRARFYDPRVGRFVTKDPSGLERNLYLYAAANPIKRSDPTGLISGLDAFIYCFNLHSGTKGVNRDILVTAQGAVHACRLAYSQDMWSQQGVFGFDLSGNLPTSGHDLFGWFLFEHGDETSLVFDATQPLTKELSNSTLINNKRIEYYRFGDTPKDVFYEYRFNVLQQLQCFTDWAFNNELLSMPISCVLGSFYYQIKTLDNGESVGFRIDNRTDLESGTHVAGRFPGANYEGSVEDLLEHNLIRGDEPLVNVLYRRFNGRKVISILSLRAREDTGTWTDARGVTHQLGGGNLVQTFLWKEKRNPCSPIIWLMGESTEIQIWDNYQTLTVSPY